MLHRWIILMTLLLPASLAAQEDIPVSPQQIRLSFAPVVKQAAPAVVNIYTKRRVVEQPSPFAGDPFFEQFFGGGYGVFGMPRERVVASLGSGVIVEADGTVVTSYHVVEGADDIVAVLADGREFAAELLVADKDYDLAVLELATQGDRLPFLPPADAETLQVGDLVLAIGNPFGVGQTVTHGIVSALARSSVNISDYSFFIQTDAAINPGNSGGALVDIEGRLIGIPTAIYSKTGASNGIGFAIPAAMVRAVLAGKQKDGKLIKPWLGATYQPLSAEIAETLNLRTPRGVLVGEVFADGPAALGGLRAGDVIIAVDNQPVDDVQALRFRTAIATIGQPVSVTLIRDGERITLPVTPSLPPDKPARDVRRLEGLHPLNGVQIANLNPALAMELNLSPTETGVVVIEGNRKFRPGDMIVAVNGVPVESTRALEALMENRLPGWRIDFKREDRLLSLQVMQ